MKGFMPDKIVRYFGFQIMGNDRWTIGGWLFVAKEYKKFLLFYRVKFERGVFEEGEF